jgi:hypothetical protein
MLRLQVLVFDRVTIVYGYAELSVMYPEHAAHREAVMRALNSLSDALEAQGNGVVAQMARSMAEIR